MIQLTDKLAVTADNECYMVGKPVEKAGIGGEKAVYLKDPHYFTTMSQAARYAVSLALRQGVANDEITTLKEFQQKAAAMMEDFTRRLAPLEY